jgi:hypothetical protein
MNTAPASRTPFGIYLSTTNPEIAQQQIGREELALAAVQAHFQDRLDPEYMVHVVGLARSDRQSPFYKPELSPSRSAHGLFAPVSFVPARAQIVEALVNKVSEGPAGALAVATTLAVARRQASWIPVRPQP